MKILIIGGTGTISSAITRQLAVSGHDLWLLNRGTRKDEVPANVRQVITNIDDEEEVLRQIGNAPFLVSRPRPALMKGCVAAWPI